MGVEHSINSNETSPTVPDEFTALIAQANTLKAALSILMIRKFVAKLRKNKSIAEEVNTRPQNNIDSSSEELSDTDAPLYNDLRLGEEVIPTEFLERFKPVVQNVCQQITTPTHEELIFVHHSFKINNKTNQEIKTDLFCVAEA